jgi:hypothetical protein
MATMSEIPVDCKVERCLAITAAMVVHVLLFLAIRFEMRPQEQIGIAVPPAREIPLEVRFVELASRSRVIPSLPARTTPVRVSRTPAKTREESVAGSAPKSAAAAETPAAPQTRAAPATPAAPDTPAAPEPTSVTRGRLQATDLPATQTAHATADTPDYTPPQPADNTGIMSHRDVVGYTKSRFEDAWAPRDETVVGRGLRRAQEAATLKKTVDFGHGVRMHCAVGPLGGGCGFGDPPSKAAAKDGDTRLSMAPARSLANDMPDAQAPPNEAACVAVYRADARVPQGCPSDTPLKAMDAENAERARRAGL